jgi:hypothetical protein
LEVVERWNMVMENASFLFRSAGKSFGHGGALPMTGSQRRQLSMKRAQADPSASKARRTHWKGLEDTFGV